MIQDQSTSESPRNAATSEAGERLVRVLKVTAAVMLALAAAVALAVGFVSAVNADLAGRSTIIESVAGWPGFPHNSDTPEMTVRLVIHRLVEGENEVEASAVFMMDGSEIAKLTREGVENLTVSVRDGSSIQPGALEQSMLVPLSVDPKGAGRIEVESRVFRLPVSSSVGGFPFDDDELYVPIYVDGSNGITYDFHLEAEKEFPGRILSVGFHKGQTPHIVLSRSRLAKILVVTSAIIFLVIRALVAVRLIVDKSSLTGLEAVLALAGFLIACGEFRAILSVQEAGDTSAFEIGAWLVPMVALATVFCVMAFREGVRKQGDVGGDHGRS